MGVTVAEGTEEVGVLDLLPVLLGVAATESDSDPSSLVYSDGMRRWRGSKRQTALNERHTVEAGSRTNSLPITQLILFLLAKRHQSQL